MSNSLLLNRKLRSFVLKEKINGECNANLVSGCFVWNVFVQVILMFFALHIMVEKLAFWMQ